MLHLPISGGVSTDVESLKRIEIGLPQRSVQEGARHRNNYRADNASRNFCSPMNSWTTYLRSMKNHLRKTHSGQFRHKCTFCNITRDDLHKVAKHELQKHKSGSSAKKKVDMKKKSSCLHCQKSMFERYLNGHLKSVVNHNLYSVQNVKKCTNATKSLRPIFQIVKSKFNF